ncbi:MAG: hypothetical protein HRT70_08865 [Flavobacteriaceae bacterium]|nr:hypothetical protein [Flavobacteriaceae bacterium]
MQITLNGGVSDIREVTLSGFTDIREEPIVEGGISDQGTIGITAAIKEGGVSDQGGVGITSPLGGFSDI